MWAVAVCRSPSLAQSPDGQIHIVFSVPHMKTIRCLACPEAQPGRAPLTEPVARMLPWKAGSAEALFVAIVPSGRYQQVSEKWIKGRYAWGATRGVYVCGESGKSTCWTQQTQTQITH